MLLLAMTYVDRCTRTRATRNAYITNQKSFLQRIATTRKVKPRPYLPVSPETERRQTR